MHGGCRRFSSAFGSRVQIYDGAAEEWRFATAQMAGNLLAALVSCGVASLILAEQGKACPRFREAAKASFEGAVKISPPSASDLLAGLRSMLASQDEPLTVYGALLEIYDLEVMVTGRSGIGKSELLSRDHRPVADDMAELRHAGGFLIGSSPDHLARYIEARGLEILDARKLFGPTAVATCVRLNLIIELSDRPSQARSGPASVLIHGTHSAQRLFGHYPSDLAIARSRPQPSNNGGNRLS